jgi:hypothetical protein
LCESLEELSKDLKDGKEDTTAYQKALAKTKVILANTLNTNTQMIDQLLAEGAITDDDIEDMAAGDSKAFEKIA